MGYVLSHGVSDDSKAIEQQWNSFCKSVEHTYPDTSAQQNVVSRLVQRFSRHKAQAEGDQGLSTSQVLHVLHDKPHLIPQVRKIIQALPATHKYILAKKLWHDLLFHQTALNTLATEYNVEVQALVSLQHELAIKVQPLLGT